MPSEGAKGVPRVTTHSCRSRTGLSSWVTGLNFSGSSGVLSAGAKGWWELVTPRCCTKALCSNPTDTRTWRAWDGCAGAGLGQTTLFKGVQERAGLQGSEF